MSTFAILGSGFGLYGYLPALIAGCGHRIALPERYQPRFFERSELAHFAGNVQWKIDENSVLNFADGVVLALPPNNQSEWIPRCLARSNLKSLFLEKPLARSPETAFAIFDDLMRSQKVFRLGYIFRFTSWGKQLLNILVSPQKEICSISIHWSFLAHHFRHNLRNWKRFNSSGGGIIRFYGIQIIALLAEIGYCNVILSRAYGAVIDEPEKWIAVFAGSGLPECEVVVDSRSSINKFQIEQTFHARAEPANSILVNLGDPFDSENVDYQLAGIDRRVPILSELCRSLYEESAGLYECYDAATKLWRLAEEKTKFEAVTTSS